MKGTPMEPTIYLFFKGNCLEAMTHYAETLAAVAQPAGLGVAGTGGEPPAMAGRIDIDTGQRA